MRKILITFVLLFMFFAGCSSMDSERKANEDKVRAMATGMGVSEEEIEARIKSLSDEELIEMSKYINEEGKFDMDKVIKEGVEENKKENNALVKHANLQEINLVCDTNEDSTHIKSGLDITLNAVGKVPDAEEVSMNNLDGYLTINIYNVKYEVEEGMYMKEYKKGDLVKTIEGNIDDLMAIKDETSFRVKYNYVYSLDVEALDLNNLTESSIDIDEEYDYNYIKYPLWLDVTYLQNGKKYREVLDYRNYGGCSIYQKISEDELKLELAKNSVIEFIELWEFSGSYAQDSNEESQLALTTGDLYEDKKIFIERFNELKDLAKYLQSKCIYAYDTNVKKACNEGEVSVKDIYSSILNQESEISNVKIIDVKKGDKLTITASYTSFSNDEKLDRMRDFILSKEADDGNWLIEEINIEEGRVISDFYANRVEAYDSVIDLFLTNDYYQSLFGYSQ